MNRQVDGKETVALSEAPHITRKAQWEMRSFLHCEKKLRSKLESESYSAAALISVFGHQFNISTHVASDQAEGYVQHFRKAFGDIEYLSPLGYYDAAGGNATGKVRKETRPPNLAFVLV